MYLEYHESAITQSVPDSRRAHAHVPEGPRRRPKVERLVGRTDRCITCDGQGEDAAGEIPVPALDGALEVLCSGTTWEGRWIEECGEIGRRHVGHEPRDRFRASESGSAHVAFKGDDRGEKELTERRLWRRMEYGTRENRQRRDP